MKDRNISRDLWSQNSSDPDVLHIFLWGHLKRKMSADKLRTAEDLRVISCEINGIFVDISQKTLMNMERCAKMFLDAGGDHLQHFH